MSAITDFLESTKTKIQNGRTAINKPVSTLRSGGGNQYSDNYNSSGEYVLNGAWVNTSDGTEYKHWGEDMYGVDGNTSEENKTFFEENGFLGVNAHLFGGDIEVMNHGSSTFGWEGGSENHQFSADVLGYETSGSATIGISEDGVVAKVSASGEIYLVQLQYDGSFGPVDASIEAAILTEASASGEISFQPWNGDMNAGVNLEAFAGAKLEGEVGIDGQYGGASVGGGVSYGIGGELDGSVGMEDGKIGVEFDMGLTFGVGLDFSVDFEVAPVDIAKDAGGAILDAGGSIVSSINPFD